MTILTKHSISFSYTKRHLALLFVPGVALLLFGCGKDPQENAAAELAASFEGSPAKEDVLQASAAFEEGRYKDSLVLLNKVAGYGDLTENQKQAMAAIVGQVLKAVHEDPQLSNDKQIHRLMEVLVRRTMGET